MTGRGRPGQPRRRAVKAADVFGPRTEDELFELIRGLSRAIHLIPPKEIGTRPARGYGFLYHTKLSIGSTAGLEDIYMINPWGVDMWRELKRDGETLSPEQEIVFDLHRAGGHDVDVWRPCDWRSGRIAREMQAFMRRRPTNIQPGVPA